MAGCHQGTLLLMGRTSVRLNDLQPQRSSLFKYSLGGRSRSRISIAMGKPQAAALISIKQGTRSVYHHPHDPNYKSGDAILIALFFILITNLLSMALCHLDQGVYWCVTALILLAVVLKNGKIIV